jgi:hypothetical protein
MDGGSIYHPIIIIIPTVYRIPIFLLIFFPQDFGGYILYKFKFSRLRIIKTFQHSKRYGKIQDIEDFKGSVCPRGSVRSN